MPINLLYPKHKRTFLYIRKGFVKARICVLINFQYILRTGKIPRFIDNRIMKDLYINWKTDDSFTKALSSVENIIIQRIKEKGSKPYKLLNKKTWSFNDRINWEKHISTEVSEEIAKISGLKEYRTIGGYKGAKEALVRAKCLNDLSYDIDKDNNDIEFDCEQMSIVEGSIIQNIENKLLPRYSFVGSYKKRTNYFYVRGVEVKFSKDIGLHALIISSVTGSIIEATAVDSIGYSTPLNDCSFKDFLKGDIYISENDNTVYGARIKKWRKMIKLSSKRFRKILFIVLFLTIAPLLLLFTLFPDGIDLSFFSFGYLFSFLPF